MSSSPRFKRVLFLCFDSLRSDRLYSNGYQMPISPTFDQMANAGISCQQAISHGCPTQISYPSTFSSTLPLDYGGYDNGIANRPTVLAEVFKQHGFRTAAFCPSSWLNSICGYHRGFDQFFSLYPIGKVWENLNKIYLKYYGSLLENQRIDERVFTDIVADLLQKNFEFIKSYLEKCLGIGDGDLAEISLCFERDTTDLLQVLNVQIAQLAQDPSQYLHSKRGFFEIENFKDFLLSRTQSHGIKKEWRSWFEDIVRKADSKGRVRYLCELLINRRQPYGSVNGAILRDKLLAWIKNNQNIPAFIWAHFLDIHDGNFSEASVQSVLANPKVALSRLKLGSKYKGDLFYDLCLNYQDQLLAQIVTFLKSNNLDDDTLFVLFGDHGVSRGEPTRSFITPVSLHEENIAVPIIIFGNGIEPRKITDLCGLVDLAPTLCDLLGFDIPASFQGIPITSKNLAKREFLIAENVGRGPGNINYKPIEIAVRTKDYKLIWNEKDQTGVAETIKLYHLAGDRYEYNDVFTDPSHKLMAEKLLKVASRRAQKIRHGEVMQFDHVGGDL